MTRYFEDLNLKDARIRRRVHTLLMHLQAGHREFIWSDLRKWCGCTSNKNSKLLRRLFIELPTTPAINLGEIRTYTLNRYALAELIERYEEGDTKQSDL